VVFITKLGPQVSLSPVPFFGVNKDFIDEEGINHELSAPYTLNKMASSRGRTVH
jgi:hypothetical protein